MKHLNRFFAAFVLLTLLAMAVMPAAAQDSNPMPNTITVIGTGSANGSPDLANVEVGVEIRDTNIATAFTTSNERIDAVINALVELGIPNEDIRTTGLNIYQDYYGGGIPMPTESGMASSPEPTYVVSNQLRIAVRDTSMVADVINTAVEAGATQIFGLNFGIDNSVELESQARSEAFDDARTRAEQLAELMGTELGDAITVNEMSGGGYAGPMLFNESAMGGGGAVIQPGQLSVSVQIQVTFQVNR